MKPATAQLECGPALQGLLQFIRCYPNISFARWETPALLTYLCVQAARDCLRLVQTPGPHGLEICGLGIGWRMARRHVEDPEFVRAPWKFAYDNPAGEVFYVDVLIGRPGATGQIVADLQWRVPNWRALEFALIRRGQLRFYPGEKFLSRVENL